MLEWQHLETSGDLRALIQQSHDTPVVIFKHSTRCGASAIIKRRLEEDWDFQNDDVATYLLDLVAYGDASNEVAKTFGVRHESPQILVIRDGRSIFDASHGDVSAAAIEQALASL
jgi:bacillithiol system protein YtxJ